jgi:hypothetical protein
VALTGATSPPAGARRHRVWMASILLSGCLAIAGTVWQARNADNRPDALSGSTVTPEPLVQKELSKTRIADLQRQVRVLQERLGELEAGRQVRTIAPETADNLTLYLRGFGTRRVIVSCVPDDLEAYGYANQLVTIFKAADWDAAGPQRTKIFGDVRSPAINLFVNNEDHSDTARILLNAFAKFNIPYQSGVTPSAAIPDTETVELFVGSMQSG